MKIIPLSSLVRRFRALICALIAITACEAFSASASAAVLLFSGHNDQKVYSYNGASVSTWGTSANGAFRPTGIAQAPDGNVYVVDYFGNHILRYPPGGGVGTELSNPSLGNGEGAAFGPDGKLYLANFTSQTITRYTIGGVNGITLDATWTPVPGDPQDEDDPGQIGGRTGLVFNGNDLYFSNYNLNKVMRYNNIVSQVGGPVVADVVLDNANNGIFQPYGLTFDNGKLLVACLGLNKIVSYDLLSPGFGTDFLPGSGPVQVLRSPDDGRLYVSNATGGTVTRYESDGTGGVNIASGINVAHFMAFIAVPEPASLSVLMLAGVGLLRRRRS